MIGNPEPPSPDGEPAPKSELCKALERLQEETNRNAHPDRGPFGRPVRQVDPASIDQLAQAIAELFKARAVQKSTVHNVLSGVSRNPAAVLQFVTACYYIQGVIDGNRLSPDKQKEWWQLATGADSAAGEDEAVAPGSSILDSAQDGHSQAPSATGVTSLIVQEIEGAAAESHIVQVRRAGSFSLGLETQPADTGHVSSEARPVEPVDSRQSIKNTKARDIFQIDVVDGNLSAKDAHE